MAHAQSDARWSVHPLQEQLKEAARAQGLWNLWLPADMAASLRPLVEGLPPSEQAALLGRGLTNLEYAHCAEVMGRSVWAPECFNCSAPDTGNMEVRACVCVCGGGGRGCMAERALHAECPCLPPNDNPTHAHTPRHLAPSPGGSALRLAHPAARLAAAAAARRGAELLCHDRACRCVLG